MNQIAAPVLRPFVRLQIEVAPPTLLGTLNGVERRMVSIVGGRVQGQFSGSILPGGTDVQSVRDDGTIELVARYAVDLGEAGHLLLENTGLRRTATEDDRPYFRGRMRFEAPAGALAWLNNAIFLTSGYRDGSVVHLEVFEVL